MSRSMASTTTTSTRVQVAFEFSVELRPGRLDLAKVGRLVNRFSGR